MIDFKTNAIILDDSLNNEVLLFTNPSEELVAFTKDEFFECLDKINELKKKYFIAGYIRYEAYKFLENTNQKFEKPALYFGVYKQPTNIKLNKNSYKPYITTEKQITKSTYQNKINTIKDEIAKGNTYQVNYTYENKVKAYCSDKNLYLSLRNKQQTSYGAFIKNDFDTIMSFSPELFFEIKNKKISTRPMKGTASRGNSKEKDEEQKKFLANDEKNRAENLMIVDLLRNDIGKISHNVNVKSLFDIETYKTLHQMTSTIEGNLKTNDARQWLEALFPCGSITGAPKINTMKIIEKTEEDERGVYCGAIGYFSPNKTVFSVPIRTLQKSDTYWSYRVGGGIVWDSKCDEEWAEAELKTSFLQPSTNFELIETMLIEDSKIKYKNEHLERLKKSAKFFGFKLNKLPKIKIKNGILRISLNKNGEINFEIKPLNALPKKIKFSDTFIDSQNVWLQHKTTYRPWYETDLENYFDLIFSNEKNEITEGTRCNIFIKKDGKLFTPPTKCGLLNGVLRQKLIDKGECQEKILYKKDILEADEIYCGNSVRGLVKVSL